MTQELEQKIKRYKIKFYTNLAIRGTLISLSIILGIYLIFNVLEFSFRFNSIFRTLVFFSFLGVSLFLLVKYVFGPLIKLWTGKYQISHEQAAVQIGGFFPQVKDKLINLLQLSRVDQGNDLIKASISQKSNEISVISFTDAIDFRSSYRYLRFFLPVAGVMLLLFLLIPQLFTESTHRLVNYKQEFIPEAPFTFELQNSSLQAFRSEDYEVNMRIKGDVVPQNIYINTNGRRVKLKKENGAYTYTFKMLQQEESFSFEAAGYYSQVFKIELLNRPNIRNFSAYLNYPAYLQKQNERLNNIGNMQVPQGTRIEWQINTQTTDDVTMFFERDSSSYRLEKQDNLFHLEKTLMKTEDYQIRLKNKFSENKELIRYHIDVIPDQMPDIYLQQFQDTTFYNYLVLGGNIADDYGLHDLNLFYKVENGSGNTESEFASMEIPIDRAKRSQSYYYQWQFDSINIKQGQKLLYYLQVRDNDQINGYKAARTSLYTFKVPNKKELKEELQKSAESTRKQIEKSLQESKELNEQIDKAIDKTKSKKQLDWNDQKMIEEIIKKKEKLEKEIKRLQEQYKADNMKRDRFTPEQKKSIKDKVKQLEQLMDELLDEETKKLYDELQKLLQENQDMDKIQDNLEKLSTEEKNLEKELERNIELLKKLRFDLKLEETLNEMEQLAKDQKELSEETRDKETPLEESEKKQDEINQEFEEQKEDLDELQELNQDMKNPRAMPDMEKEKQEIESEQQKANEALQKKQRKKAGMSQEKMSQQMQQMQIKMSQMQQSGEMKMVQENLQDLINIEDNLLKLSFGQENLMKEFRMVNQSDPRFVELSQKQLKLKDDSKVIEDSLLSLAKRVFQISAFVTREVGNMNRFMDESLDALKERNKNAAVGKQQFAMTSMNNLALLLDDVIKQMQQQMSDGMGGGEGKPQPGPSLSEMQKQLNEKINQLKKSGKTGRQLSEELAKLAAEQEMIREALQQQQQDADNKRNKDGQGNAKEAIEKMEETELDLVNKNLTQRMIDRQKEILNRLLEAENADRERELDKEREGETAREMEDRVPPAFEEYIKAKEQEIELLKTVPPKLNPYYKNEVNEYFKRLNN